jgi:hypothetical protein
MNHDIFIYSYYGEIIFDLCDFILLDFFFLYTTHINWGLLHSGTSFSPHNFVNVLFILLVCVRFGL